MLCGWGILHNGCLRPVLLVYWLTEDEGASLTQCSKVHSEVTSNWISKRNTSLGGLEPPTFRLTAERANRLRHRDR